MSRLRVSVGREFCIGAANCVRLASNVFALDEERLAFVHDGDAGSEEELRAAERSYPAGAILVEDVHGESA